MPPRKVLRNYHDFEACFKMASEKLLISWMNGNLAMRFTDART